MRAPIEIRKRSQRPKDVYLRGLEEERRKDAGRIRGSDDPNDGIVEKRIAHAHARGAPQKAGKRVRKVQTLEAAAESREAVHDSRFPNRVAAGRTGNDEPRLHEWLEVTSAPGGDVANTRSKKAHSPLLPRERLHDAIFLPHRGPVEDPCSETTELKHHETKEIIDYHRTEKRRFPRCGCRLQDDDALAIPKRAALALCAVLERKPSSRTRRSPRRSSPRWIPRCTSPMTHR